MKIRWEQVFEELDPPPGGLEALRRRLHQASALESRARRRVRRTRLAVAAAAACLVIWLAIPGSWPLDQGPSSLQLELASEGNPALVRLGLAAPQDEAVVVPVGVRHRIAVEQVTTGDPDVIYYRVAVLSRP
jgi:hypothetical protein